MESSGFFSFINLFVQCPRISFFEVPTYGLINVDHAHFFQWLLLPTLLSYRGFAFEWGPSWSYDLLFLALQYASSLTTPLSHKIVLEFSQCLRDWNLTNVKRLRLLTDLPRLFINESRTCLFRHNILDVYTGSLVIILAPLDD